MMSLGFIGDGFAVGDLRRLGIHQHAAMRHLFENQPQVQFTHPVDHYFMRLRVVVPFESRVFFNQFVQLHRQLGFIPARLGRDRQAIHRHWILQRLAMHAVERVIIVQHIVKMNVLDLRDTADVA